MNPWKVVYDQRNPEKEPLQEALCTLGNGYFATRGAAEENRAGGRHYPGTYLAGGYNRLESEISGRVIENEDLVNWPNWLFLTFRHPGGSWLDLDAVELLAYRKELDLRKGLLERTIRIRDEQHRETSIVSRRIVHMKDPHLAAMEWTLIPENWSGPIEVHAALDGTVVNSGVERYRKLASQHLEPAGANRVGEDGVCLLVRSNQSRIEMAQAARLRLYSDGVQVAAKRRTILEKNYAAQEVGFLCERHHPVCVEKVVSLYTNRDDAISQAKNEAERAILRAGSFEGLLESHAGAWARLWHRCDIEVENDGGVQHLLRLHIFHLLQTVSVNTIDLDAGVPARGLHGEAYRGHIFWDELFIFPFLNLRIPELTRAVQMYRYRRLPEARRAAQEERHCGAMYPWQSGSNGREESQVLHLNPQSGEWIPDHSQLQRHINAAIAFNIWQYFQATGDMEFLSFYGAEMILEIARFWGSLALFNPERGRYEIRSVVGPDEYHTHYPDSDRPGLDNNAYTNIMAVWTLRCALRVLELLATDRREELQEELGIDDEELSRWRVLTQKMFIPFHGRGMISQFEGYEKLEEFPWKEYRKKYGDIERLDRILGAEGVGPDRYKAAKQADVLMLFYLFSSEELGEILEGLGYPFHPEAIPEIISYYGKRTSHGSTLSRLVHSWVMARSDREQSWHLFEQALMSDFRDIQGGTTPEGIHLGAMAGTVDLIQRCYTGLEIRDDVLWLNPILPRELKQIKLHIRYRSHWIMVRVRHDSLVVSFERGWSQEVRIGVKGKVHRFGQGEIREFPL